MTDSSPMTVIYDNLHSLHHPTLESGPPPTTPPPGPQLPTVPQLAGVQGHMVLSGSGTLQSGAVLQ